MIKFAKQASGHITFESKLAYHRFSFTFNIYIAFISTLFSPDIKHVKETHLEVQKWHSQGLQHHQNTKNTIYKLMAESGLTVCISQAS